MAKQTISIPTHPYGLATRVDRETQADIYGEFIAVHPTFWGPPGANIKGKQGWKNWSVTFLPEGTLIAAFLCQKTAKKFATEALRGHNINRDSLLDEFSRSWLVELAKHHMKSEVAQ